MVKLPPGNEGTQWRLGLALLFALAGPARPDFPRSPLRVGGDHQYPPYEYLNTQGEPNGYAVDLTRAVARELGLEVNFHLGPWTDAVARLERGEVDLLQGMFYSPRRAEKFLFSPPHFHNHYVTVGRKNDGPPPNDVEGLSQRVLCTQAGDWINDWLADRVPHVPIFRVPSQADVLDAVSSGKADCGIVVQSRSVRDLAKNRFPNLWISKQPLCSADYCFAFRKDRPDLLSLFTEGLRMVEESGEHQRIAKKWFGLIEPSRWEIVSSYVVWSSGPLAAALLLFFLWTWSLQRAVRRRTALLRENEALLRKELDRRLEHEKKILHLNGLLKTIRNVNQLIVRETDPVRLLEQSVSLLVESYGYGAVLLVWLDESGSQVRHAAAAGLASAATWIEEIRQGKLPPCILTLPPWPAVGRIERSRALCQNCLSFSLHQNGPTLGSRLVCHDRLYGYLLASYRGEVETETEEIELFKELAGDLAFALHAHRQEELHRQAEEEARHLAEAVAQAEKLAAVGRLAAGVAHDFNNLVMGILGYIEFCKEELSTDHPAIQYLNEIARTGKRTGDLVRQLLAFARKQIISPKVLNLHDELMGQRTMLRHFLREDIELRWDLSPDVPPVRMDPTQIHQILLNLCSNAQKAIQGSGRITIETRTVALSRTDCASLPDAHPGTWIRLTISDTGCGMSPEIRAHLFEPFFTTQPAGQGTGLGLASVLGIVKQNGGFITVESEIGKGSAFHIFLPPAPAESPSAEKAAPAETIPPDVPPIGSQTILLVEDNPSILHMLERFLQRLGYQVLAAASPLEALALPPDRLQTVDLVLTDVILPEMNGRELVRRLHSLAPSASSLYISGYTSNVIAHEGILEEGVPFVSKPVELNTLAAKIREILQRPASSKEK